MAAVLAGRECLHDFCAGAMVRAEALASLVSTARFFGSVAAERYPFNESDCQGRTSFWLIAGRFGLGNQPRSVNSGRDGLRRPGVAVTG